MSQEYYQELVSYIKEAKPSKDKLSKQKIQLCKKYDLKRIPTDIEVLLNISKEDLEQVKPFLLTKPQRSISGVAPVALMSRPHKCPHGTCTYCPGGPASVFGNVPQSYTGKEPTTRRAIRNKYDPYLQVMNRLEQYMVTGHVPEKVDLIFMGGTLPGLSVEYQEEFTELCFKAMNDFSDLFFKNGEFDLEGFKEFFELPGDIHDDTRLDRLHAKLLALKEKRTSLEEEQKKNESADIRCIGLTIETKPDFALLEHANEMLKLGCTRVEVGIQTVYDEVLKLINRGHGIQESIDATRILKDMGFKINYHMMPGLPTVSYDRDLASLKTIFSDDKYRPDMIKIYPCMVLKGTALYDDWKAGTFKPIKAADAAKLIVDFMPFIPPYCRMMRVQRDIPTYMTEDGVERTNLRQYVDALAKEKGIVSQDIRAREVGRTTVSDISGYTVDVIEYTASQGKEFFIQAQKDNALIGFCRLRFPSSQLRSEISSTSVLIRELHVYGMATAIGSEGDVQHRGVGKELLAKAESIASENGFDKMVVISGVGVREYYKKLGYEREGAYMVKMLG